MTQYTATVTSYKSTEMFVIQVAEGVKPTLAELEKFEEAPEGIEIDIGAAPVGESGHKLAPGDLVEVAEGELIHLQGKVIKVEGNKITMMPKHEDLKALYSIYILLRYS